MSICKGKARPFLSKRFLKQANQSPSTGLDGCGTGRSKIRERTPQRDAFLGRSDRTFTYVADRALCTLWRAFFPFRKACPSASFEWNRFALKPIVISQV